ncbi:Uncharacterised protein [Shigella sonnei]|nr:Uncharacterised protein [Shigella sonnei]
MLAPATSQAKSFQLQPLPSGRLSQSSFDAPKLTENINPNMALRSRLIP